MTQEYLFLRCTVYVNGKVNYLYKGRTRPAFFSPHSSWVGKSMMDCSCKGVTGMETKQGRTVAGGVCVCVTLARHSWYTTHTPHQHHMQVVEQHQQELGKTQG